MNTTTMADILFWSVASFLRPYNCFVGLCVLSVVKELCALILRLNNVRVYVAYSYSSLSIGFHVEGTFP